MKIYHFILFFVLSFLSISLKTVGPTNRNQYFDKETEKTLANLQNGQLPILKWLEMVKPSVTKGLASDSSSDASCNYIQQNAKALCESVSSKYQHKALKFFNSTLCRLNNETPAGVENVLCHFRKSIGIKVDLYSLCF